MSNPRGSLSGGGDWSEEDINPLGWDYNSQDLSTAVSESQWRAKKKTTLQGIQTDELHYSEEGVQAAPVGNDKVVQTDPEKSEFLKQGDPYPPSLFAFFSKVTDSVCEILRENEDPFLNDLFSDHHQNDEEERKLEEEVAKIFELKNGATPEGVTASCVAWNKTGGQIAVGYAYSDHEGWCTHRMPVCTWNINRTEAVDPKTPHITIDFGACISFLEFHPIENTLLAVGLHSGEISLVDLSLSSYFTGVSKNPTEKSNEGPMNVKIKNDCVLDMHGEAHNRKIVSAKWARLSQGQASGLFKVHAAGSSISLVTASTDGYIALWSVSKAGTKIFLEKLFLVSTENLSEDIEVGNRFKLGMKEIGVTSMGCCKDDPVTLVFATHGSFVFQGSLLSDLEISETAVNRNETENQQYPLLDPVTTVVAQDQGLISAIDCCPHFRNLFLYLTSEGLCVIQNLSQPMVPSMTVVQDYGGVCKDVKWSPRPLLFALINNTSLIFYDMKEFEETSQPTLELDHEEELLRIAFNKTRPELLAVSDVQGTVHIWKLPSGLMTPTNLDRELDYLIQIGQTEAKK